jgi:hypothetical protein
MWGQDERRIPGPAARVPGLSRARAVESSLLVDRVRRLRSDQQEEGPLRIIVHNGRTVVFD